MSWTELKARIADWLNRDDLAAQIPAFIALAEARFNRVLIVPEREAVATLEASGEPAPASACELVLDYFATIPPLGEAQPSNWLLDLFPDLYLSGALVEAYLFLRDAEGAGAWDNRTEAKIREIEKAGRRQTIGAAPLTARAPASVAGVQA